MRKINSKHDHTILNSPCYIHMYVLQCFILLNYNYLEQSVFITAIDEKLQKECTKYIYVKISTLNSQCYMYIVILHIIVFRKSKSLEDLIDH